MKRRAAKAAFVSDRSRVPDELGPQANESSTKVGTVKVLENLLILHPLSEYNYKTRERSYVDFGRGYKVDQLRNG
jgi:hypothetical protein